MNESIRPAPLRRVVTGHDANGVAGVLWDAPVERFKTGKSGLLLHLWNTAQTPADIRAGSDVDDPAEQPHVTPPPPGGTRFVMIDYPPGNQGAMHRTESLDYVIVLCGEIDMVMDDATVHLGTGDVMIQRGTNHAWFNRGTQTARLAFVLVDAVPLGIGHPRTSE